VAVRGLILIREFGHMNWLSTVTVRVTLMRELHAVRNGWKGTRKVLLVLIVGPFKLRISNLVIRSQSSRVYYASIFWTRTNVGEPLLRSKFAHFLHFLVKVQIPWSIKWLCQGCVGGTILRFNVLRMALVSRVCLFGNYWATCKRNSLSTFKQMSCLVFELWWWGSYWILWKWSQSGCKTRLCSFFH